MTKISSTDEVIKNYDAFIIDIWGVIYDGSKPYEGTVAYLNKMIDEGKSIIFLSNAPRPGSLSEQKFSHWGINMKNSSVYTSGDYFREQLLNSTDRKKVYHLGAERNQDILADIEVETVENIKEAECLLLTIFVDDKEDLSHYDDLLKEAANLKIPAICANPDLTVIESNKTRYCAGTFAKKYTQLGGVVEYYGKPDSRIFNKILAKYEKMGITNRKKILMIGDTLETDILGANKVGLDSALVLTGNGRNGSNLSITPTWIIQGIF